MNGESIQRCEEGRCVLLLVNELVMPKADSQYMNISLLANYICNPNNLTDEMKMVSLKTLPKKGISTIVNIDHIRDKVELSYEITPYDLAVMDAVYTLYINDIIIFTPEMVARYMSGNLQQDVTKKKETVISSLEKLSVIRIYIDCTEEFIARKKIDKGSSVALKSNLLLLEGVRYKVANHKEVDAYRLLDEPILYYYANIVGQITKIPMDILDTSRTLCDTDEVIVIKRYLIRRIQTMKNTKNNIKSNKIIYERYDYHQNKEAGMFPALGINQRDYKSQKSWQNKKNKIHHSVCRILDDFSQKGYIKGYKVEKNRAIEGVSIQL